MSMEDNVWLPIESSLSSAYVGTKTVGYGLESRNTLPLSISHFYLKSKSDKSFGKTIKVCQDVAKADLFGCKHVNNHRETVIDIREM